jgi:uncharacterized membrane protein
MAAVALGLSCAFAWGMADFLAGSAARRISLVSILTVSQTVGLATATVVVLIAGEPLPPGGTLAEAAASGLLMILAISSFYRSLSLGLMGVVAPIMATSAVIPVVYGAATGDALSGLQVGGIVLCFAGVVLASRSPTQAAEEQSSDGRAALAFALLAMVAFGCFLVLFDRASEHGVLWGATITRAVALVAVLAVAAAMRDRITFPDRGLAWIPVVGVLDVGGLIAFGLATGKGLLSVVAILASLHPVVTGILARTLLDERLARVQGIGIAGALVGVIALAAS